MYLKLVCLIIIVSSKLSLVLGQNWLIEYLLPKDYDPDIPPIIDGECYVNSTIRIHTFRIVDEQEVNY